MPRGKGFGKILPSGRTETNIHKRAAALTKLPPHCRHCRNGQFLPPRRRGEVARPRKCAARPRSSRRWSAPPLCRWAVRRGEIFPGLVVESLASRGNAGNLACALRHRRRFLSGLIDPAAHSLGPFTEISSVHALAGAETACKACGKNIPLPRAGRLWRARERCRNRNCFFVRCRARKRYGLCLNHVPAKNQLLRSFLRLRSLPVDLTAYPVPFCAGVDSRFHRFAGQSI